MKIMRSEFHIYYQTVSLESFLLSSFALFDMSQTKDFRLLVIRFLLVRSASENYGWGKGDMRKMSNPYLTWKLSYL